MKVLLSIALSALIFLQCGLLDQLEERLNILTVNFRSEGVDLALITPSILGKQQIDIPGFQKSDWGIRLMWRINADNPNTKPAAFDGAGLDLRVNKISDADEIIPGTLPAFRVGADSAQTCTASVPITLDKWTMPYDVLRKIVNGDKIPYRLTAKLLYNLVAPGINGLDDTLGKGEVPVDLVADSLNTRPKVDSAEMQAFLNALTYFGM